MKEVKIGQRWLYKPDKWYIIAEISSVEPTKTKILVVNDYSNNRGYKVGDNRDSMGIPDLYDWLYLTNQDKPND